MSRPFPYTFISCPCSSSQAAATGSKRSSWDPFDPAINSIASKRRSVTFDDIEEKREKEAKEESKVESESGAKQPPRKEEGETDADAHQSFNSRTARSNFSLFPPEHLLYCEDCHQIKCPRCVTEEIACWYCPNCLFETPSSMIKGDGNRCGRNCFNCPVCTSPLSVSSLGDSSTQNSPWILSCGYCMWTTLDIGIQLEKSTNIRAQLSTLSKSSIPSDSTRHSHPAETSPTGNEDISSRFNALKTFYRNQISETSNSSEDSYMGSELGGYYSTPGTLNRIMNLYSAGIGLHGGSKKSKAKPPVMREAFTEAEGLQTGDKSTDDRIVRKFQSGDCTWDSLTSIEQRLSQLPGTVLAEDLRPLPVLLRTKRSKRCKQCKHILVKPEFKPQSTRFRIRLIALSYIPLTTIRPLNPSGTSTPSLSSRSGPSPGPIDMQGLAPDQPVQYLITMKNHMFDSIRISLGTPSITPGSVKTKVTLLCPTFEIGANNDVWDEALATGTTGGDGASDSKSGRSGERVAEAGKVWDKGRNWTTVVMEIVPGRLPPSPRGRHYGDSDSAEEDEGEDEDVVEIPIHVRLEWEGETAAEDDMSLRNPETTTQEAEKKTDPVKRELAYWMVLGVGRIRRD